MAWCRITSGYSNITDSETENKPLTDRGNPIKSKVEMACVRDHRIYSNIDGKSNLTSSRANSKRSRIASPSLRVLLELISNDGPRLMTVHDRKRVID